MQILGNLPVNVENVTSLMHASIDGASNEEEVKKAVDELLRDPFVPFGERDGNLRFNSEKLYDIEQERANLPLRSADLRQIKNESLTNAFNHPRLIYTVHSWCKPVLKQ